MFSLVSSLIIWNTGSVFESYDTIISWNKWAIDWANNSLPTSTWRYPQLLPANWSIIYVLMGTTTVQFFVKAMMPFFTLFILLMIIDLGFAKSNPGFFIGSAITYFVIKKFLGPFVIEGLADMLGDDDDSEDDDEDDDEDDEDDTKKSKRKKFASKTIT